MAVWCFDVLGVLDSTAFCVAYLFGPKWLGFGVRSEWRLIALSLLLMAAALLRPREYTKPEMNLVAFRMQIAYLHYFVRNDRDIFDGVSF